MYAAVGDAVCVAARDVVVVCSPVREVAALACVAPINSIIKKAQIPFIVTYDSAVLISDTSKNVVKDLQFVKMLL